MISELGAPPETNGKMPDLVVYVREKNRLVLVEAATGDGPIDPRRRDDLKSLFGNSKARLMFVTAFLNREAMTKHLGDISWKTEVWVADSPDHLIHFNGGTFLGPYAPK